MSRKPNYEVVIKGRMVQVWRRRGYVEARVYSGPEADDNPISEWELPHQLRYSLYVAANLAESQTARS